MGLVSRIRTVIVTISLLFACFYPALASVIYTPVSYHTACNFHGRCQAKDSEWLNKRIDELVAYWRHDRSRLNKAWTDKERQHLREVRGIYDQLVWGFPIALIVLLSFASRQNMLAAARFNSLFFLSLILFIPLFNPFWKEIFHPLMFDNQLWNNTSADSSWYFMPKTFFRVSTTYIIIVTATLNLLLWQYLRIQLKRQEKLQTALQ
jgi:uncharacterized membrane protein